MVANAGVCFIKSLSQSTSLRAYECIDRYRPLPLPPLISATVQDWDNIFAVNARGVFLCYKYAVEQMIKQGKGGRIIGASSVVGKQGG